MDTAHDHLPVTGSPPHGATVTAWMTIGETRATLVASGQRALPVNGHDGLIGLITIEALSGPEGGPCPQPEDPVLKVMDWHLVQLPPDADERQVVRTFTDAAWAWLRTRTVELEPPSARHQTTVADPAPPGGKPHVGRRHPIWWMG